MATWKGPDVSKWQGSTNLAAAKAAGAQFVIARAGYGWAISQKDAQFEANYQKAKAAGLPIGAYWYSYAKTVAQAKSEAATCIAVLKGKQFELPIYFDIEDPSQKNLGKQLITDMAVAFCQALEAAGYYVGIYANLDWFKNRLDYNRISRYTLWLAQWSAAPTFGKPIGMWQYTNQGALNGISGRIDMNIMYQDFPTIIKNAGKNGFPKGSGGGSTPAPTPTPTPTKTIEQLADEVQAGKWGNGDARVQKLTAAGYDAKAVQARVNEKYYGGNGTAAPSATYYTVKRNDNLTNIAKKYGTTVAQIVAWNKAKYPNLAKNPNLIQVGWSLRVK